MRDCQPSPVALKYSKTSRLYRTDTSCFAFPDFGRPRSARIGIMDFSCFDVSGCASGSAFAAAVIALSSREAGITTEGRLDALDIVFQLPTIGSAQAAEPSHLTTIHKGYVVKDLDLRCEGNRSQLAIFDAFIDPNQRSFPIEFACHGQRDTVLCTVRYVFGWIKLNSHALL